MRRGALRTKDRHPLIQFVSDQCEGGLSPALTRRSIDQLIASIEEAGRKARLGPTREQVISYDPNTINKIDYWIREARRICDRRQW
jgi:hypothetical protein